MAFLLRTSLKRARAAVAVPAVWVPLQSASALPRSAVHTRTQSSATGPSSMTSDEIERVRAIAADVTAGVKKGIDDMKTVYGDSMTEKVWMINFYKHKDAARLLPAYALMTAAISASTGTPAHRIPTVSAKDAIFLAHVLRGLDEASLSRAAASMTMTEGTDIAFVLAVLHQVGNKAGQAAYDRIAVSMRRSGNRALLAAGQHVGSVPVTPVLGWPIPFEDEGYTASYRNSTGPHEVTPIFSAAKEMLDAQDWLLMSSTCVVECLWSSFYATGDAVYIHRICDVAAHWGAFTTQLEGHAQYLVSMTTKLPEDVTKHDGSPASMARSVAVQVSRAACWSLIQHAMRNSVVTRAIADQISKLSYALADEQASKEAREAVPEAFRDLATAQHKMDVLPTLLYLISESRVHSLKAAAAAEPVVGAR